MSITLAKKKQIQHIKYEPTIVHFNDCSIDFIFGELIWNYIGKNKVFPTWIIKSIGK